MKKIFNKTQLLTLLLFLISVGITSQTISNDNIEDQIEKGIIKSLTEYNYRLNTSEKFGEITTEKVLWNKSYRSFDKKGRTISRIFYDGNGKTTFNKVHTFNDEEKSRESIGYNSDGKIDQRWKAFSDKNGNEFKNYDIGLNNKNMDIKNGDVIQVMITPIEYEYNDDDQLLRQIKYNEDKSIYYKKINQYYKDGTIKESHFIYLDDVPNSKYASANKIKYNNKGKQIEKYNYDSDGDLSEKYRYEYNAAGDLLKSYQYRSNESLFQVCKYDDNGNKTKDEIYEFGAITFESTYTYEFDYDTNNNWIKKTTHKKMPKSKYSSGAEINIEERIIEYY